MYHRSRKEPDADVVEKLRAIVAQLPPREREAMHRFYVLEQPSTEVLGALGMTESELLAIKLGVKRAYAQIVADSVTRV